jgi:methylenetetrahydrofolate dehydrogenase (NADP+)/methenyltetrahydrofolate cyclohydrolase
MAARIIDGNAIAEQIKRTLSAQAAELAATGASPRLVAVQVGANPSSRIYTNAQAQECAKVGIEYRLEELPEQTTQADLIARLERLGADPSADGVILQMPLPPHIDARVVQTRIPPMKDVEAVNPVNMGALFFGGALCRPCTPAAAVEMLLASGANVRGADTVIIGRSEIVGKPLAIMLLEKSLSATVTVCHTGTADLAGHARRADVLIAATGRSQINWLAYSRQLKAGQAPPPPDLSPLVTADMVKPGAVVIDIAINRIPRALDAAGVPRKNAQGKNDMATVGDVDFEPVRQIASAISPVPGGVGPVTVAVLLRNTIACAKAARMMR